MNSCQLLRRLGYDPRTVMWHWSVTAWQIGVSMSVLWAFNRSPLFAVDDPAKVEAWHIHGRALAWQSADGERILFAAVGVGVVTLFIFAIWVRRKRISAMIIR